MYGRIFLQIVAIATCVVSVNPVNSSASVNTDAAFKRDTTYAHYGYGHQGATHDRSDYSPDRSSYGGGAGGGSGGYGSSGSPGMSALALLGFLFFLNMISQALMMPMMTTPMVRRKKRSSPFPEGENELWSLLYDASHISSTAIQTYTRALEAQSDSCIQQLLCEMNQKKLDNSTDVRRFIGQMASSAISFALHGDDIEKHESNLAASHLGGKGGSCHHLFHRCATNAR